MKNEEWNTTTKTENLMQRVPLPYRLPEKESVGDRPPGTTRWYMGRTIRGGLAHEIKTGTALLAVHRKRL
jgi:hypothetical protein